MSTDTGVMNMEGIQLWDAPKRPLEDAILIIYSVANTAAHHKQIASLAVREYRRKDIRDDRPADPQRFVRTKPEEFKIPAAAGAGRALGTELVDKLRRCVGAIAFIDDMRPNIAYELGFFHGMGRPVLLLTNQVFEHGFGNSITDLV